MMMAAKITIQDITDAGFRGEQFGTPKGDDASSWGGAGGYLSRLIDRAERWARGRIGAAYDAIDVDTPRGESLRAAELCWASGNLWLRRAAFIDSNAASSLDNLVHADRREFEAQAQRAFDCAESNLQMALSPDDPAGMAIGFAVAESGPWLRSRPA